MHAGEANKNLGKPNSLRLKIKILKHGCKPYSRLLGLIFEEILLMVVYVLLSFTDQFSSSYYQYE